MQFPLQTLLLIALLTPSPFAQSPDLADRLQWTDLNADGIRDAFLILPGGKGRLLVGTKDGGFADQTLQLGLSAVGPVREAKWGDAEGDGVPELLLVDEQGRACLYAQDVAGVFTSCPERMQVPSAAHVDEAAWTDFDLDGDEDLLLRTREGGVLLLRSDENGQLAQVDLGTALSAVPEPGEDVPSVKVERDPAIAASAMPATPAAPTSTAGPSTSEDPGRSSASETNSKTRGTSSRTPFAAGSSLSSSSPSLPLSLPAAPAIRDQATGGTLKASSTPTLGMLFPLSPQFYLDAVTGFVGVGTTSPDAGLQVTAGTETQAGGGDFLRVGASLGQSLGLDPDEIQARSGGIPSDMHINENGGSVLIGALSSAPRVGIGTTVPSASLDIAKGKEVRSGFAGGFMQVGSAFRNLAFDGDEIQARELVDSGTLRLNEDGGDVLIGGRPLQLQFTRVGIHTESPSAVLHVANGFETGQQGGDYLRLGGSTGVSLGFDDDEIQARTDGVAATLKVNEDGGDVLISSNLPTGSLGIRTNAPQAPIHVENGNTSTLAGGDFVRLGSTSGPNLGIDDSSILARNNGAPSTLSINESGGDVVLGSETTSGRVGIGTPTPQFDVHVRGDGTTGTVLVTPNTANSNAELRLAENTSASLGAILRYNGAKNDLEIRGYTASGESGVQFFVDRDTGVAGFPTSSAKVGIGTSAPTFNLHVNGTAGKPGGGSWSVASDRRLKKNVHALEGALERLMKLRGVTYEYHDPEAIHELPGEQIGMIAQEVAEVFPDWVEEAEDGYLRLSIRGFEALTVEALRELREEKEEELQALRAEYEARIAALEARVAARPAADAR